MRFIVFVVLTLSIYSNLSAQERYQTNKVIPPSPTAASLGVYGDVPVSYYTGSHNFSIPLYDIKTSNHSLPITLQYNGSAIKVGQDASWVGLGWSLSAGGVITRTVRGLDDFSNDKGYNVIASLPPHDSIDGNNGLFSGTSNNQAWNYGFYFRDIRDGVKDGDPDVFFYNFGGYSGKFVLGKLGDGRHVYSAQINNLKITFSGDINSGSYGTWTIITPDGYQYYFSTPEVMESYYSNSPMPQTEYQGLNGQYFNRSYNELVSSWYLDSIEAPSKEKISFTYETGRSLSSIAESEKRYDRINGTVAEVYDYINLSRTDTRDVYLKKIEFSNGYLLFNRTNRIDIEPFPGNTTIPQKLSEIVLYNNANQLVKKYTLGHSYFNNNTTGLSYHYKRLKLDNLTESGSDGVSKNPFVFSYYDPENLPSKYNRQTDIWGYYASFYSPTLPGDLRPTLLPEVTINTNTGPQTFAGIERVPDSTGDLIKKGILSSVLYPTGGKTVFDYEPNERSLSVATTYTTSVPTYSVFQNDYYLPEDNKPFQDFELTSSTSVQVNLHAYNLASSDPVPTDELVYIFNRADNSMVRIFDLINGNSVNNDPSNKTQTWNFTLPAGSYGLQCNFIADLSIDCSLQAGQPQTITTNSVVNKKGGGLRVKSIENFDFNNNKISSKKFIYTTDGTASGFSSGLIIKEPPKYFEQHVVVCDQNGSQEGDCIIRSSNSLNVPGLYSEAAPVCYSNVYVYEGANGEGGSTHYQYFNAFVPTTYDYRECQMPSAMDNRNGKLLMSEVRDNTGTLLKKNEYKYSLNHADTLKGAIILKGYMDHCETYSYDMIGYYDNISEWWVPSEERETNYLNNQEYVTYKKISYDNFLHKNKTSEEILQSDGSLVSVTYKYPHDFITQAPFDAMVAKNIISPVVEQSTSKINGQVTIPLESSKTNFFDWNGFIAPSSVESKKGSSNYQTRLLFYDYDDNGHLLSTSKEKDVKSSYLWAYNKSLPIIKADNIDASGLRSAVDFVLVDMGVAGGINGLDNYLNSIGSLTTSSQKASWKTFNQKLQTYFASQKVLLSTITYSPLIGVTSETDTNNRSVYYEYDSFGRLVVVRDNDGNILQSNKYNYRQ